MAATTQELHSSVLEDVRRTRASLLEARHLPGYFYTDPAIFALEVERIFMKEWLCVGRLEEFETPGDYHAFRIVNEPVLVTRDKAGVLHAFRNLCRHRGVEVATGQGSAKQFTCPYHAWVYDLDGHLKGAPHVKELQDFDIAGCRLPEIRVADWGGYVFVNFDPDSPDLADYLDIDGVREFAAFLQPERTRTSNKFVFEVPCNWKFVPENLMDMYHVGVIHKESFGGYFPVNDFRYRLKKHGYSAVYESFTMAPGGATLFGPMPWLEGKVSDRFACTTWLRPTMNLFGRHDLIQPWVATPIDVNRTRVEIYTQLPAEFFDHPAFAERNRIYADFIKLVALEDQAMLESLQNGVGSRGYEPGPTVKLERAIHHLLNYYLDILVGEDDAARARRIDEGEASVAAAAAKAPARDAGYSRAIAAAE